MAPRMQYDIFIAHASEDKQSVVRPLARLLDSHGLRVWVDEYALNLGDSLRESIDRGLARSRFGLVVLSPAFFQKTWPQRELNALVSREANQGKVLLPVWHNLDATQIAERSPLLSDRLAVTTADGLAHVALEIYRTVMAAERPKRSGAKQPSKKSGPNWFGERTSLTPSLRLRTATFQFEREARPPQYRVTGRGVPGTMQMPNDWRAKQVEESLSTNDLFHHLWEGRLSPAILEVVVDNTDVAVSLTDRSIRLVVEIYPDDALPVLPTYGNWFRSHARGIWSLTNVERIQSKERWLLPSALEAEKRSGPEEILRMAIVTPASSSLVRSRSKEVQLTITIEGHRLLPITASWSIASVWWQPPSTHEHASSS